MNTYSRNDIDEAIQDAFNGLLEDLGYIEGCAISEFLILFEKALEKRRVRLRSVKLPKDTDGK